MMATSYSKNGWTLVKFDLNYHAAHYAPEFPRLADVWLSSLRQLSPCLQTLTTHLKYYSPPTPSESKMPWDIIKFNDGNQIPGIGFGTWKIPVGDTTVDQVDQAISVGFNHIDTAQAYRNEEEAGKAIHESGLKRDEIFITTKYSGLNGLDIETSIKNSLKNLGVQYIDLYLIHHPRLAVPDIPTAWRQMEGLKNAGLVKSIGISNFEIEHVDTLLASAKIVPAVNQIILHPYAYKRQAPLLEYLNEKGIVYEAYSPLIPVTQFPGGPVDKPVKAAAKRLNATDDQILLAWAKAKGAVVLTSSSKKYRLEGYLEAGDLVLTDDEIKAIDDAGAKGTRIFTARTIVRRTAAVLFAGAIALGVCSYLGIDVV
ncbi:NAD/NADP-dependent indole-3-acetaldehyde reductase [Psilocybe cubensis]|uniref:NAD/NADP-dependent indole-3-acetaldehyde reductase n=2 Tax=Psilocybe cubensis TaxID=181762 RepID=A0ACB8GKR8_PSICU|nr:NAD/NADP-dependent indole-3-acetaldehyde reductase [Psilocybe cubensis]KAH9476055.1 NAD/NADP-dependent indole-3-acetaldehyde reductase [Psilocybe cubensis]